MEIQCRFYITADLNNTAHTYLFVMEWFIHHSVNTRSGRGFQIIPSDCSEFALALVRRSPLGLSSMSTASRRLLHPVPFIHGAKGRILRCKRSLVCRWWCFWRFLSDPVSARPSVYVEEIWTPWWSFETAGSRNLSQIVIGKCDATPHEYCTSTYP